jgi:predicted membrane protein
MIADTNSVFDFGYNVLTGVVGGDWVFLGILLFIALGLGLIYSRARASSVVMVGVALAFLFGLMVPGAFMFVFWISIVVSLFVLVNGLRKWITGQ